MKQSLRVGIFCLFLVLFTTVGHTQETDTRLAFDSYQAAYTNYQNAVNQNLSAETVKNLAAAFEKARVNYINSLNTAATKNVGMNSSGEQTSGTASPPIQSPQVKNYNLSRAKSGSPTPLPENLKSILNDLWKEENRNHPDSAMQNLESFIGNNPQSLWVFRAKYELAKSYELLEGDLSKSASILKGLSQDTKAGNFQKLANDRLQYVQATGQYRQWKTALSSKNQGMDQSYKKFKNTSWLALPVKLFRWGEYASKMLSFTDGQDSFEEFMLLYENLASKFIPPVGFVFDQFIPSKGPGGLPAPSKVSLIYQNSHAWYTRWKLLNEAHTSLDVQYYIVDSDVFGFALQGLLLRKAREGLKIRFMMDARGTLNFTRKLLGQDFVQELVVYPNVEVKVYNPVHEDLIAMFHDPRMVMASNHDKIIAVDGRYTVLGGRNVAVNYFVDPGDLPTVFRDCDVVIENVDIARQLSEAFEEEFNHPKNTTITPDLFGNIDSESKTLDAAFNCMDSFMKDGKVYHPENTDNETAQTIKGFNDELELYKGMTAFDEFDPFANSHEVPIKIIDKNSLVGPRNDITEQLVRFIDGARKEIIIQNPYVVLSDRMDAALKRATKRGVQIIVHTNSPTSTDSFATQAMFYADWKRILKEIPTCRIFVYSGQRKLHAKTFVFDGQISIVGTYNMDLISEQVNSEVVSAVKSIEFATELRNEIFKDISISKQYQIEVEADGTIKSVYGPDDLPGKKMWLLHLMSKFTFLKSVIFEG
ncbi:MAG: phosphatidylserine/phosphatidylglycerophosphate/cardiolipin synthase family protein [Candidatus Riflebacteria bacterium]|nr:phosphatidylserine/phosphatidylglycerophosphate/cardiolipin synthase family protein [Candidatus Riflebacteria bacterium]